MLRADSVHFMNCAHFNGVCDVASAAGDRSNPVAESLKSGCMGEERVFGIYVTRSRNISNKSRFLYVHAYGPKRVHSDPLFPKAQAL